MNATAIKQQLTHIPEPDQVAVHSLDCNQRCAWSFATLFVFPGRVDQEPDRRCIGVSRIGALLVCSMHGIKLGLAVLGLADVT